MVASRHSARKPVVFELLMLVFSGVSSFGTGGFVVGALLGIMRGVMNLRWRGPAPVLNP